MLGQPTPSAEREPRCRRPWFRPLGVASIALRLGPSATRNEVLIAEATTKPTIGASCKLTGGRWHSYYDNADWTLASDLDIDHLVPLAEAWDSGARNWTAAQREQYANDLGDARDLVAVTDNVNQAKGDRTRPSGCPRRPARPAATSPSGRP
jgi:hypothetical protein